MVRLPAPLAILAAGAAVLGGPAAAEDFTGFYAGVNAGYAFERSREASVQRPEESAAERGLPPSAETAARALRAARARTDGSAR